MKNIFIWNYLAVKGIGGGVSGKIFNLAYFIIRWFSYLSSFQNGLNQLPIPTGYYFKRLYVKDGIAKYRGNPLLLKNTQFSYKNECHFIFIAFGKLKIDIEHPCGGFKKSDAGFFEILIFSAEMAVRSHNLGHFLKICENLWPYLLKKSKFQKNPASLFSTPPPPTRMLYANF